MYVELTRDLVATIIAAFCDKRDIIPKHKEINKVLKAIIHDEDVKKSFFCEAICVGSGQPCMREVQDEESFCHFHDPALQCKGIKKDGNACASVAKKLSTFCWRHVQADEEHDVYEVPKKNKKNKYKHKSHSTPDKSEEESEDVTVTKKKHKKSKKLQESVKRDADGEMDFVHKKSKKSKKNKKRKVRQTDEMSSSSDDDSGKKVVLSEADDEPRFSTPVFPLRDAE
jgi:hypothetical protein